MFCNHWWLPWCCGRWIRIGWTAVVEQCSDEYLFRILKRVLTINNNDNGHNNSSQGVAYDWSTHAVDWTHAHTQTDVYVRILYTDDNNENDYNNIHSMLGLLCESIYSIVWPTEASPKRRWKWASWVRADKKWRMNRNEKKTSFGVCMCVCFKSFSEVCGNSLRVEQTCSYTLPSTINPK